MKYKAVIFDLFGTLVENFSRRDYEKTLAEMAAVVEVPPDKFIKWWSDTFDLRATGHFSSAETCVVHICRELNAPVNETQLKRTGKIRIDFTARNLKPRIDAIKTIKTLKSKGYKIGLISDCTAETPLAWPKTALAQLFDVTVFSCLAGIKKPDPNIYKMAADQLHVKQQECLYISDGSSRELTGASKVGMHAVLIRVPTETADAHTIEREDWHGPTITSLKEVLNLL